MNANVVVKFQADTSDIDRKLGQVAKRGSVAGGATATEFKKANDERIKAEKQFSTSLDQIAKERTANEQKYHVLSFKDLDKAYTDRHNLVKNREEQIRRTKDTEQKATLRQELQNVKFENQALDKEYKSRPQVMNQGAGAKNGILGLGRNLISQSGSPIGAVLGSGGGALAGITAGIALAKEAVQAFSKYEDSLADLSALTGVKGKSLDELGDKARNLALQFGTSAPDAIESFKLVISALGPDIAKDQSALNEMGKDVMTLAKASGTDATQATASLTNTLNQFGGASLSSGEQAKQMTRIMNVMAAGALQGAAEIPDLAEAMKEVGTVAKTAGLSIEDTTASIEILSQNGIKGSEAGVAFKEVLMKMSSGSKDAQKALDSLGLSFYDINPQINGQEKAFANLKTALDKVKDPVQRAADLEHLFGIRATVGAQILMNNSVAVDGNASALRNMTTAITGTNTAQEQSDTKLKTLSARWGIFMAKVGEAAIWLGEKLAPVVSALLDVLGFLADKINWVIKAFQLVVAPITLLIPPLMSVAKWFGHLLAKFSEVTGITSVITGAFNLIKKEINDIWEWIVKTYHNAEALLSKATGGLLGRTKKEQESDNNNAGIKRVVTQDIAAENEHARQMRVVKDQIIKTQTDEDQKAKDKATQEARVKEQDKLRQHYEEDVSREMKTLFKL